MGVDCNDAHVIFYCNVSTTIEVKPAIANSPLAISMNFDHTKPKYEASAVWTDARRGIFSLYLIPFTL